jgi:hypothetical protein
MKFVSFKIFILKQWCNAVGNPSYTVIIPWSYTLSSSFCPPVIVYCMSSSFSDRHGSEVLFSNLYAGRLDFYC